MSNKSTSENRRKTDEKRNPAKELEAQHVQPSATESIEEDTQSTYQSTDPSVNSYLSSEGEDSEDFYKRAEINLSETPPKWVSANKRSASLTTDQPTTAKTAANLTKNTENQTRALTTGELYHLLQRLLVKASNIAPNQKLKTAMRAATFQLHEKRQEFKHIEILSTVIGAITTKTALGNRLTEKKFLENLMKTPEMEQLLADPRGRDALRATAQQLPSKNRVLILGPVNAAEKKTIDVPDRPTIVEPTTAQTSFPETSKIDSQPTTQRSAAKKTNVEKKEDEYSYSMTRVFMKALELNPSKKLENTISNVFADYENEKKTSLAALSMVIGATTTQTKLGNMLTEEKFLKALMKTPEMENLLADPRGRGELQSAAQKLPSRNREIIFVAVKKATEKAESKENKSSVNTK